MAAVWPLVAAYPACRRRASTGITGDTPMSLAASDIEEGARDERSLFACEP